jgi:two-component SAPR family response regulator
VPERTSTTRRVLVAEDEALIAMLLEDLLEELGFESRTCASVSEALDALDRSDFPFAILDVNLGTGVSYPVADLLIARGIPFAFATGYSGRGIDSAYASAAILRKPFDKEQLSKVIERLKGEPLGAKIP